MQPLYTPPLVVVLDTDTVSTASPGGVEQYLINLLGIPGFTILRYSDHIPATHGLQQSDAFDVDYTPGWVRIDETFDDGWGAAGLATYSDHPSRVSQTVIRGGDQLEVTLHFAQLQRVGATDGERKQLRRDFIVGLAAQAVGSVALVTNRDSLLSTIPGLPSQLHDSNVALRPDQAVILIGFLLRAKGMYVHSLGGGIMACDRWVFYAVAAQNLLPGQWRWRDALRRASEVHDGHDVPRWRDLRGLSIAQTNRVATAIKARDRARRAAGLMSSSDARDESVDCVDAVALNLMGAFDATARFIEALNPTGTKQQHVGWQRHDWGEKQRRSLPIVIDTARQHENVMTVIRLLRNTIHARAMHFITVVDDDDDRDESYIALPDADTDALRSAFGGSGGLNRWGVTELYLGRLCADFTVLIDEMISQGAAALNDIMAATPVERLLNVAGPLATAPRDTTFMNAGGRESIRQQVGL